MRALDARLITVQALLKGQEYVPGPAQRAFRWGPHDVSVFWQDIIGGFDSGDAAASRLLGAIIAIKSGRAWRVVDGEERLICILLVAIALLRRLRSGEAVRKTLERAVLRPTRWSHARGFAVRGEAEEALFDTLLAHGALRRIDTGAAHTQRMVARYEELSQKIDMRLTSDKELRAFTGHFLRHLRLLRVSATDADSAFMIRTAVRERDQPAMSGHVLERGLSELASDEAGQDALRNWSTVAEAARTDTFGLASEEEMLASVLTAQVVDASALSRGGSSAVQTLRSDPAGWLMQSAAALNLTSAEGQQVLAQSLTHVGEHWLVIERAASEPGTGLDEFAFARGVGLNDLWRALALAALTPDDASDAITAKLATAAAFIDILAARCAWAPRGRDAAQFEAYLLRLIAGARGQDAGALADFLTAELDWVQAPFNAVTIQLGEPGHERRTVRHILARLTADVELRFGGAAGSYADYLREGPTGFSIEQMIAPSGQLSRAGQPSSTVRDEVRLQLGDLVLLPTHLQRDLANEPARAKAPRYAEAANLIARALSDAAGRESPDVRRYIETTNAPIISEGRISGDDIKARNAHYGKLAASLWDPRRITSAART